MNRYGISVSQMNTFRSFPHSRLITGFTTRLTRRVSLMEQKLPTLPEHLSSPPVFNGVRVTRSVCPFVLFLLAIVLSVLLQYTNSDYPFGIFKLFLTGLIFFIYEKLQAQQVSLVEQELLTFPKHLSSSKGFAGFVLHEL